MQTTNDIDTETDKENTVYILGPDKLNKLYRDIKQFEANLKLILKNIDIWDELTTEYLAEGSKDIAKLARMTEIEKETTPLLKEIGINLPLTGLVRITKETYSQICDYIWNASSDEMYIELFALNPLYDAITDALENDALSIEKEINALEMDKVGLKNKMTTRVFKDSAISEKERLTDAKQKYKNKYGHDAEYSPYLLSAIQCIKAGTPLEVILEWYNYDKNGGAQNKIMPDTPNHNEAYEGLKKIRASTKESKKNKIGSEEELRMLYNCAFAICALDLKQKEALKYAETDAKKYDLRIAPIYRAVQRKEKMISERDNLKRVTQSDLSAINKYF